MVDGAVLDLLGFYQRDLRESADGRKALAKLGITSPEVVDHFGLGWCSGRALKAASEEQYRHFETLGLASRHREALSGCVVMPVHDENGTLVDLHGLRVYRSQRGSGVRYVNWQEPPRGLIGLAAVKTGGEVILAENAFHALHIRQHGYPNVVALRGAGEIRNAARLLQKHDVVRVFLVTRHDKNRLVPVLEKAGIQVESIVVPSSAVVIPKESLNAVEIAPPPPRAVEVCAMGRTDNRLVFGCGETVYRVESTAAVGLGVKSRVKAEKEEKSFLDKVDLASAAGRRKFAQLAGLRLGVPGSEVENHLSAIADHIDRLECELAAAQSRAPKALSADEEKDALDLLKDPKLLDVLAGALDSELIGEEANKKLVILVGTSRLLDKPLGGIVRGSAGSGKSQLIQSVGKLLPMSEVLVLSKLTPQALFYMPRETLQHKLMVVDEYEGLADAEHPLRTMMSSQSLSLAITLREGGRVPVTKTIEIPACLAVLVSTTQAVNVENLSRFIELRMDDSAQQTHKVLQGMAARSSCPSAPGALVAIQNAMQLLKPCAVTVSFAEKLVYESNSVLARRQFGQVVGLISAHAALSQHQRERQERSDGTLVVTAEKKDYEVVHRLLGHVVEHVEESLSPSAMALLKRLQAQRKGTFTRKEAMQWTGWCYSRTYRVLQELMSLDLLMTDKGANGILKIYEVAPYCLERGGIGRMPAPKSV